MKKEENSRVAFRAVRFALKKALYYDFGQYTNIKNLDHHCLLNPMVQVLFFTDEARYSKKITFLKSFL